MLNLDDTLLKCVVYGATEGLQMTGIVPEAVGASRFIQANREFSVLVSLHGGRSGTININMTRYTALFLAARLLGEETPREEVDEDTLDAVCEIGNIVAGRFKSFLSKTPYHFSDLSLPALVAGANYSFYHNRGMETVSVEFEIKEIPMAHIRDRVFSASISLLRNAGQ